MIDTLLSRTSAPEAEPAGEALLLARTARGDREAFRRLYFIFHRRLGRFLMRLTHRPEITEEIINDTMLVVWQHAAEFRGESRISTWILGIAYRRALKALTHEPKLESLSESTEILPFEPKSTEELASRAELTDWLEAALARLSAEHRLVIELAYGLGLSCEEIAEISHCPLNTVKTRMFYARQRLRQLLIALAAPGLKGAAT